MIVKTIHRPETAFLFYLEDTLDRFQHHVTHGEFPDDDAREEERLELYEMLTEEQRQEVWGLSADLYSLLDKERRPVTEVADAKEDIAAQLEAAYGSSNWTALLRLLRNQAGVIERPVVDYMRFRAWSELGYPSVALAFIRNAVRLDPLDAEYKHLLLELLKRMKDWDELQQRADQFLADFPDQAGVLLAVGESYHDLAVYHQDQLFDLKAVECLRKGLAAGETVALLDSQLKSSVVTLAFALLSLDRTDEAIERLGSWIERRSDNAELFAARGIVRLTTEYEAAINDFKSAVQFNTKFVLPYFELSNWFLHGNQSELAIETAVNGLKCVRRPSDRAKLLHLMAIGYALQNRVDPALALMNEASQCDPTDRSLIANFRMLKRANRTLWPSPASFQLPTREPWDVRMLLRQLAA